ncbi:hypothetical protein N7524_004039, partial [Penicillium chrysogenum]
EDEVFEDTVTEIDDDTPASDFALASGSISTSVPTPAPASDPTPAPTAAKTAITKRKYKPSMKPDDFVNKWRLLYNEMQGAFPIKQRIPPLFALYTFLYAVGNNTACQNWLNSVTIHDEWLYNKNLQYFISAFITSEGRRLLNNHSKESKKKKKDKSKDNSKKDRDKKKSAKKQYYPFHKRETVHKAKDCFLNPKKKDKSESANKANAAADKPAITTSTSIENL